MKTILLGITGSIAAYKAADLANQLTKIGYSVDVVMTESAVKFITPLTLQALTKNKVYTDMFDEITPEEIKHISLAKKADVCIIAPATANIIGKIANGIADDFLSTVILALKDKPVFIAPAMNTNMYENPIVQENIEKLKARGFLIIEPKESMLACGDLGKGAMADVSEIMDRIFTS
ncbi:MAG TPA: bifunctional phosphopantothenoylcysteine decarboxylase/phosphopantothenate--cysteine ligase CoaBC [Anaerovoracaceae bacterium]|nr:bifunctional phosphopantothenoylcysteine decarboxylase/phosphopantothenate--cysteine ligase CoaBC [Anaerovoracaceae bacterium]